MKTVLFDVDGVLVDFVYGFTSLAAAHGWIKEPIATCDQPQWDFTWCMSREQESQLWQEVGKIHDWWVSLSPIPSEMTFSLLSYAAWNNRIIYCTNRSSGTPHTQNQTTRWLRPYVSNPSVIVSKRKGEIARALDADYAIDDKAENAACIHWMADIQPCKSYILDRPYNRNIPLPKKVRRVYSVDEFLDDVQKGK